jgi:glycosyltransferase involved in cell wall biosynthesis
MRKLDLVSCIMPTRDRRAFVPAALEHFFAQDHPSLELIVVDDGSDPVADLMPGDPRVRYFRLDGRHTVGAKRNIACELALGDVIVHWDDDDWYPSTRVTRQIAALCDRRADLCGSSTLYFHDRDRGRAWLYRYSGRAAWVAGATLAYRRSVWQRTPFADMQIGEDAQFVRSHAAAPIADLRQPSLCVATIHAGNVCPKRTTGKFWTPLPEERVRAVMAAVPPPPPLVSCIMPTFNRRPFIPLALACFRQQRYPNRELVVIDDGDDPVEDLLRGEKEVRYVRVPRRTSIGAKRNIGCAEARGELIALWDDDDWYGPARLDQQVAPLRRAEADITALENRVTLQLPQRKFWTVSSRLHQKMFACDVTGGTTVFRKSIWRDGLKFVESNLGEDANFLRRATRSGRRLRRIVNDGLFIYVRHGRNTWRFEEGRFLDPAGWSEMPCPREFSPSLDAYATAAAWS